MKTFSEAREQNKRRPHIAIGITLAPRRVVIWVLEGRVLG